MWHRWWWRNFVFQLAVIGNRKKIKKDVQLDGDDNKNKKKVDDTDCEKEDQDSIEQVCLQSRHICILTVSRYFRIDHL